MVCFFLDGATGFFLEKEGADLVVSGQLLFKNN